MLSTYLGAMFKNGSSKMQKSAFDLRTRYISAIRASQYGQLAELEMHAINQHGIYIIR
jgi:hypothetical protein